MYLLTLNPELMVTSCLFTEEVIELSEGQVETSWDDYLAVVKSPTTPFKFEGGVLSEIASPSVYHSWVDCAWVLDSAKLQAAQAAMWSQIKSLRDSKLTNGGYPTNVGWFHSDDSAQLNYEDLYKVKGLLSQMPPNYWKMMSGSFIVMTAAIVDAIFSSKITQKSNLFTKAEQHKAAMQASSDPLNYDYTTGWPAVYGE